MSAAIRFGVVGISTNCGQCVYTVHPIDVQNINCSIQKPCHLQNHSTLSDRWSSWNNLSSCFPFFLSPITHIANWIFSCLIFSFCLVHFIHQFCKISHLLHFNYPLHRLYYNDVVPIATICCNNIIPRHTIYLSACLCITANTNKIDEIPGCLEF